MKGLTQMAVKTITITVDDSTGLTGREIGKMIERAVMHVDPPIEVTATPTTIDIRFEKQFAPDITIEGELYRRMRKTIGKKNLTPEQILKAGAKRYGFDI